MSYYGEPTMDMLLGHWREYFHIIERNGTPLYRGNHVKIGVRLWLR